MPLCLKSANQEGTYHTHSSVLLLSVACKQDWQCGSAAAGCIWPYTLIQVYQVPIYQAPKLHAVLHTTMAVCCATDKLGQDFWFYGVLVNLDIQALHLDEALYFIKATSPEATVDDEEECPICLDSPLQVSTLPRSVDC